MKKLFLPLLTQASSFASLLGLLFSLDNKIENYGIVQWGLLSLVVITLIVSCYRVINDYNKNKPKIYEDKRTIRDYMYNWINTDGRVLIFTRDLSWVDDRDMEMLLKNKSENSELIICLPKRIDKIREFENLGATIIEYPQFNFTPQSRFTITHYDRADARIAVGKKINNKNHIIEEYSNGEHPYFNVALDLVNFIINSNNVERKTEEKI